jgi:hypothetical protein
MVCAFFFRRKAPGFGYGRKSPHRRTMRIAGEEGAKLFSGKVTGQKSTRMEWKNYYYAGTKWFPLGQRI